jgi:hypothetical protein
MTEKNLVTFIKSKGKIDSIEICLDGNHFDWEFISDTYDILPFNQRFKIFYEYQIEGKQVIDIQDEDGKILTTFKTEFFIPYNGNLKRDYKNYLKSKD